MSPKEFIDYFDSFYGPNGIYPIGFKYTTKQIRLCIELRGEQFDGDSFDREAIRDILLVVNNKLGGVASVGLKGVV